MKKYLLLLFLLLLLVPAKAQIKLSDEAQISILTAAPSDEAVFTLYGHTAVRVKDSLHKIDLVFNYGIFDFSKPNFIYRFTKGETDYKLAAYNFQHYIIEYQMRGSEVTEQVLNFTPDEINKIWNALYINVQPENCVYRYNFFFDNCATRPVAIVEEQVDGKIKYNDPPEPQTFRDLINYCTRNNSWLTFGCDLALGSPTDRVATPHEMMFLPVYLKEEFDKATIVNPDGTERKLVKSTTRLAEELTDDDQGEKEWFTPMLCSMIIFLLVSLITYMEWKKKTYFRLVDCILFLLAGVAGTVLFFLCFISTHPCIWPNWSIVWLQPFDLVAVILFAVKKYGKAAYYYHFINFAALTLLLAGWYFIPQHLNIAFIPLVATLWLRSGFGVYRGRMHI
ncbi:MULTISPECIES: lipoprotein N-acyltransferase Lnb domain-containing protein [Parabacteroides]|jgi:hypothetical protein|uniref:Uncharacterized protein n=1 Tax=Parabacteroides gordonii MS-1 = DSM 23371 TaxID=1203610 RepID=A0A0F5JR93_9BACT|nr:MULTISPECIES: DUF4105 domain-containing protein [Parabacteroides]KKB50126.1 hypothetical protein HMPREF1212_03286 [Parabacteroides sp. HGS0025]KKB60321.1 hypothetical protein HMPREF1536_00201 [Parabacteroides gordonii MS-1 = DSM 23371]MCA5584276.1 DUF4105 domain-containing protein [Parabacteroides gordonii]